MTTVALVVGESPVQLWYLDSKQRISRQLTQSGNIPVITDTAEIPQGSTVLLVAANYLFEVRTFTALLERSNSALHFGDDGRPAAAVVDAENAQTVLDIMSGTSAKPILPSGIEKLSVLDLGVFDHQLRKAKPPLLQPVTPSAGNDLEALLYGTSYKGITDLVTKFVWPRPARTAVRFCARFGISPNMVTTIGFLLMLWACYLFTQGQFMAGLLAGWIMTYLDTVDGKLARVTIKSSKFGHLFDHGMDIIHPPFWYYYWGMALASFEPVWGMSQMDLFWVILGGYIGGRLVEVLFHLLGSCSIFSWRPFDAYFRLITARRNPCMILLTASVLVGRPDWGFIAVAVWTAGTTILLLVRLFQGMWSRMRSGPLESWLSDPESAAALHPRAHQTFSATQSAYQVAPTSS